MVSRKQEGKFHWYNVITEEQLQELPHHIPCSSYPPLSSQHLTTRTSNLSNSRASRLSWSHVSSLIDGKISGWETQLRTSVYRKHSKQDDFCHNPAFMLDAFSPALLASFLQNFLPSRISPMLSPASCLTFILSHFHRICLSFSCACLYQLTEGLFTVCFASHGYEHHILLFSSVWPVWDVSSGGKNMHSVLAQHREEHGLSTTFTQINYLLFFQSVPDLSVIYNTQMVMWGSPSHVTQNFVS